MGTTARCLIFGRDDMEVKKLHFFPTSLDRSRIYGKETWEWLSDSSLRKSRICNLHFSGDSYLDEVFWRLKKNAVPTLLPCTIDSPIGAPDKAMSEETESGPVIQEVSENVDSEMNVEIQEPSTSKDTTVHRLFNPSSCLETPEENKITHCSESTWNNNYPLMAVPRTRKNKCCVPNCPNINFNENVRYFTFPNKQEKTMQWLKLINCEELLAVKVSTIINSYKICERHFDISQFQTKERLKLNRVANPSLFLNNEESNELDTSHMTPTIQIPVEITDDHIDDSSVIIEVTYNFTK